MKKLCVIFLALPLLVNAQKPVQSEITNVIVYQNGAKITNTASANLPAGTSEVIVKGVPANIDPNSIQVKVLGNAVLLSATSRIKTLTDENLPVRTKILEDSLQLLNQQIQWLKAEKAVYEGEQNVIVANQKLGSNEQKVSVDEIIQLADFYRKRLLDIKTRTNKIDVDVSKTEKEIQKITQKLNEIRYTEPKTIGEIVLSISAKAAVNVKLNMAYVCYQAGWTPIYDLRAESADKPVKLLYKANVYQQTGINWENVKLTISTGNPLANNDRPLMYPWYIDFARAIAYKAEYDKKMMMQNSMQRSMAADKPVAYEAEPELEEVATIGYGVSTTTNRISAAYTIDVPQTIPSDQQVHLVAIVDYELNSKFSYHAIPKLDPSTFLIAKIADYGNYNLLPGQANLFYEGMYIGQSFLNPATTVDSMLVSLGRDEKITVKRNQLKDLTARQSIGTNTKETKAYEISIRNNNTFDIELELMDQVPIAQNKEIEVKLEEGSGAKYDADYGSLLWKINLKAGETKKVKLVYSVKYPKDKAVAGL